jgi:uncharacterized protein YegP (UPF0339 family)
MRSRRLLRLVLVGAMLGVAGALGGTLATASAQVSPLPLPITLSPPTPSDPTRATFVFDNVVTCAGAGFPLAIQMGSPDNASAADANVSGTVAPNAGPIHTGEGEELNVTIIGADVVIDAVIVKGGAAHNLYSNPAVLPPALLSPQHYISPFNGGGAVPTISHWFVCYHLTTPEPVGTLTVEKGVLPPDGRPVSPLPTTFTAVVNCNDGIPAHQNVVVTFARGGGRAATGTTLTGIPIGAVCTVVEQNTGSFPAGTTVAYIPAGANTTGVIIGATAGAVVDIINDFTGVPVRTAPISITKAVVPVAGVLTPTSFTAHIRCDDGVTDTDVSVPGTGEVGTPVVSVKILSVCLVEEIAASIPAGWTVTYSLNGRAPTPTPPTFAILDETAITVAITNDPSGAGVAGGSTGAATSGTGGGVAAGSLARTGSPTVITAITGLLSVAGGAALLAESRALRPRHRARRRRRAVPPERRPDGAIRPTREGTSMPAKYVVKKGPTGKFRFSLHAANGEIIASSEAYNSKAAALNGIAAVRNVAAAATVEDQTAAKNAAPATKATSKRPSATKASARRR